MNTRMMRCRWPSMRGGLHADVLAVTVNFPTAGLHTTRHVEHQRGLARRPPALRARVRTISPDDC